MNQFLISSKRLIEAHGESMVYSVVTEGEYDVETGQTINTETAYTVKMYKKHINATQYSYPTLVGKTSAMFYLVNTGIAFVPSVNDKITVNSETFVINSIVEHRAQHELALYRIIAIKG